MSRFQPSSIYQYTCNCSSKGDVWVPSIGSCPGRYTCRSPICNALIGQKKLSVSELRLVIAQGRLSALDKQLAVLLREKLELQQLAQNLFASRAAAVAEGDQKLIDAEMRFKKELEAERNQVATTIVKLFPVPSRPVEEDRSTIKKTKLPTMTGKPKKKVQFTVSPIRKVTKTTIDLPPNYMVGDSYVSGIVEEFREFGF